MQSVENEWEEHMEEVKNDLDKLDSEAPRDLDDLTDVVRNKVYLMAKM
jgi:ferritin-like protein